MQVVAKDASLEDRLHLADVLGGQLAGLVELDPDERSVLGPRRPVSRGRPVRFLALG
jgi:hypothetical protein